MVKVENISWSSFESFEGPFYRGTRKFVLPEGADEMSKQLAAITAVESGHYDAINCYDRAIVSVGLIQWTEANQYTVSGLLGEVAERNGLQSVLGPLAPALRASNATFRKNAKAQWRFHFNDGRGEVDNLKEQQDLFLLCDGKKGSWTPASIEHAKLWAACLANVWDSIGAQRAQVSYTRFRLKWFLSPTATETLMDGTDDVGLRGALRAAYLTFAVNNPTRASNMLIEALKKTSAEKWSEEWCIDVLKELTFGPKIKFYPIRYNGIRPVLEDLWDVSLPKTAEDLASWQPPVVVVEEPVLFDDITPTPTSSERPTVPDRPSNTTTSDLQDDIMDVKPPEPSGPLGFILWLLRKLFGMFTPNKG